MSTGLVLLLAALLALMIIAGVLLWSARGQRPALLVAGVVVALALVTAVGYRVVGQYPALAAYEDARQSLTTLLHKARAGEELTEADVAQLVLGLRGELQQRDDVQGWLLLGRLAWDIDDGEMSAGAFERAHTLAPDQPATQREYGRILLAMNDTDAQRRGEALLNRLAQQPDELEAPSILAFYHLQRQEMDATIGYWQMLRDRLNPDDPRRAMVEDALAQLRKTAADEGAPPPQGMAVYVKIALAPGLEIPPQARLLVFAKAVDGPPMPLAVKELKPTSWPVEVILRDEDAMMPQLRLSQFSAIEITARLTTSESVKAVAGDLEGRSAAVVLQELDGPVALTIDTSL